MPDMQREIERVTRDFVFSELAHLILSGALGQMEIRFESDADRRAFNLSLKRSRSCPSLSHLPSAHS
jgi:hypothetical protein